MVMSNLVTYKGIVIDVSVFKDNDARVSLLCDDNEKRVFVARGVLKPKSKNATVTQLLSVVSFQGIYKISGMLPLRNGNLIKTYHNIQSDLLRQSVANFVVEYAYKCKNEIMLYSNVIEALNALETLMNPWYVLCAFQAKINAIQGITPFVDGCVNCLKEAFIHEISIIKGGVLCVECASNEHQFTKAQLQHFRFFCKLPQTQLYDYETSISATYEDFLILFMFFDDYTGINLHTKRFIDEIARL